MQRFYGEIAINAYYFITMIYGVFVWRKRVGGTKDSEMTVHTRQMKVQRMAVIGVLTVFVSWLTGWGLSAWTAIFGCVYDNTRVGGAGIADSGLPRALVYMAGGGCG